MFLRTVEVHLEMYMYNFQPNQKQIFGFISFTLDKKLWIAAFRYNPLPRYMWCLILAYVVHTNNLNPFPLLVKKVNVIISSEKLVSIMRHIWRSLMTRLKNSA